MLDISSQFILWMLGVRSFEPQWNFTSIYKKIIIFFWKRKKFEIFFETFFENFQIFPKFLRSKKSKIFRSEKFRKFSKRIQQKFRNFRKSEKIENLKFFSKIWKFFENFQKISRTFFIFKKIDDFFFIDRCKILLRFECAHLEGPEN